MMGRATAKAELFAQWLQGNLVIADQSESTGARFWVKSTGTDSAGYGNSPDKPFASLDYASTKCTASKGDIVYVMEGHAETIIAATGCNLAVAGVRVVGLGAGANRPTYTFTTANAATVTIDAANVTIENLLFVCAKDGQTAMLDVNADDCTVRRCEFRADDTYQPATFIDLTSAAANGADRLTVEGCIILSLTAGATQGIELGEVNDGVILRHNWIYGDFTSAGIHNPTGKIMTRLLIEDNYVANLNAGDHAIELVSACTGMCVGNRLYGDTIGTILDPGSLFCNDNFEVDAIDESGVPTPATPATGQFDSADFAANTFVNAAFADDVFDSSHFAAGAFDSTAFAAGAITAAAIADGAIDAATFAANALANAAFADDVFDSSHFAASAFDSTMYARDAHVAFNRGIRVIKASLNLPATGASTIFTVATGRVLLTGILGEMTTQAEAKANNVKLISTPTTGSAVDICANIDINALQTGGLLSITGTVADAGLKANAGAIRMQPIGVVLAVGTLGVNTDTTATGAFKWDAWYLPLDQGATLA